MIGAIKRRWKSNKKCSDKDKEKVTPLPSFPPGSGPGLSGTGPSRLRKGPALPVDFIHVNSGRIELVPVTNSEKEHRWGQHLHYETRHSWCGPQQMGVPDKQQQEVHQGQLGTKKEHVLKKCQSDHHQQEVLILARLSELEKASKGVPNLEPALIALKEEVTASVDRQEKLVSDLESLHLRVHTLETNNKALANIILPTLIRLTKEKSSASSSSRSSSLKKVAVATSPIKIAKTVRPTTPISDSSNIPSTEVSCKMRQNSGIPTTPTKIPGKPIPNKKKPVSLDLKKPPAPSGLPPPTKPPFSTSTSTYTTTECRIPFFRPNTTTNSTTHPPKTALSKGKPKSRLPVRKSCSSSGPSTSASSATPTGIPTLNSNSSLLSPSSKAKKLSTPLIIQNKMRFIPNTDPKRGGTSTVVTTVPSGLPPKDEGYSTMSNGAIDSTIEAPQPPTSTATFNRPKKVGESSSSNGTSTWTKNKTNKKLTSSPTAATSSTSPSRSPTGRTLATATVLEPGASITTTKENVRIVRGLPTEIRFSSQSSDDFSGGTVLLEDSDDSDILFLPIEVSSTSGSDSTLVPYPYSRSPRSRSTSASKSTRSKSRYNTDTNSTTDSTSTYYTAQQGGTTTDSSDATSTPTPTHGRKKAHHQNHVAGGMPWDAVGLEVDEQDLVQRWMRLEDMRNEEEAVGDEEQLQLWSWDWDGIIHSNAANNRKDSKKQVHRLSKDCEPWDHKFSVPHPEKQSKLPPSSPLYVDSSTWTKSKKRKSLLDPASLLTPTIGGLNPSPSPSLTLTTDSSEAVPPLLTSELDFTAEFYRLTSSGTEDKIIQTETDSSTSSSLEDDYNSGEAPAEPLSEQESDLFLQCKNCLEKMGKLISLQQQQDNRQPLQVPHSHPSRDDDQYKMSISEQFAQLLKLNNSHHHHHHAKEGSASKWLPVPRSSFRASPQGDRNYTLLSSTESEGLVSPSME